MAGFRDMSGFRIIAGLMDMVCFRVMADFRPQSIRNVRTIAVSQPYLNASDTKRPTFPHIFGKSAIFGTILAYRLDALS